MLHSADDILTPITQALFPADEFSDFREAVASEHHAISSCRVDDDPSTTPEAQANFLVAHLVGSNRRGAESWGDLLVRTKLAQVIMGGTGLSVEGFDALTRALRTPSPWRGAWTSAHGAGDAIPGAWFVHNLRADHGLILSQAGDLRALMSGNFASTAAAAVAAVSFAATVRGAMTLVTAVAESAGGSAQIPVTLRDIDRIERHLCAVESELVGAIVARMSQPSADPLYVLGDSEADAPPQSSFVDFRMTSALSAAIQSIQQLAAYVRAAMMWTARVDDTEAPRARPSLAIQPVISELALIHPASMFTVLDGDGIHDVCDMSLQTSRQLLTATRLLSQLAPAQILPTRLARFLAARAALI